MRYILALPFRTLFFAADIIIRIVVFALGFSIRTLLFLTTRAGAIILGILIGLAVERKWMAEDGRR